MRMSTTHAILARGFAKLAATHDRPQLVKDAAARRWLEDQDLVKLCRLFKNQPAKTAK